MPAPPDLFSLWNGTVPVQGPVDKYRCKGHCIVSGSPKQKALAFYEPWGHEEGKEGGVEVEKF